MLTAILILTGLAVACGLILAAGAGRFRPARLDGIVAQIDARLPQTQCGQCGYPGCLPYARALAKGSADINQCPPGGESTIRALADLLGRPYKRLNPAFGVEEPKLVAVIDESACIGCALCTPACPVDAILGAPRHMHTVIESECTGCGLCLPPCPVDCVEMVPVTLAAAIHKRAPAGSFANA